MSKRPLPSGTFQALDRSLLATGHHDGHHVTSAVEGCFSFLFVPRSVCERALLFFIVFSGRMK